MFLKTKFLLAFNHLERWPRYVINFCQSIVLFTIKLIQLPLVQIEDIILNEPENGEFTTSLDVPFKHQE